VSKFLYIVSVVLAAWARGQAVEGTLINSFTKVGIGGAKVVLQQGQTSPYPATTDATGRSLIENVRDGAYSVRYEVDANFFPTRRSMSIQVPAGAASVRIEGRLVPLARISGRVIDPRGQVVADAVVELTTLPSFWTARTDPGITESMTNCPLSCLSPYPHTRYAGCS